jgi:hypothetical protein
VSGSQDEKQTSSANSLGDNVQAGVSFVRWVQPVGATL